MDLVRVAFELRVGDQGVVMQDLTPGFLPAFRCIKEKLAAMRTRDPLKARKDALQAEIVSQLVRDYAFGKLGSGCMLRSGKLQVYAGAGENEDVVLQDQT